MIKGFANNVDPDAMACDNLYSNLYCLPFLFVTTSICYFFLFYFFVLHLFFFFFGGNNGPIQSQETEESISETEG